MLLVAVLYLLELTAFSRAECGVILNKAGERIVGGTESEYLQYPWFANLRRKDLGSQHWCGGALITRRHVITAAHCFPSDPSPEKLFTVVLNSFNGCDHKDPNREVHKVAKVVIHEKFKEDTHYDLAMMTLDQATDLERICLPQLSAQNKSEPGLIMGMGYTEEGGASGQPCKLHQANVHKYSPEECLKTDVPDFYQNTGLSFCGGGGTGVGTCQGDSGGPFITYASNGRAIVSGVDSGGVGCARENLPAVYTNLAAHLDWIAEKIDGEETETGIKDNDSNNNADTESAEEAKYYNSGASDFNDKAFDNGQKILFPGQSSK